VKNDKKINELKRAPKRTEKGTFKPGESGCPDGGKQYLFVSTVRRAIAQDNGKRLRGCAERLLDLAAAGEAWAVKELADRLDGRAHQSVSADLNGSLTVEIVRLANPTAS
jgi:hypothetical protein